MIQILPLNCSSSSLVVESKSGHEIRRASTVSCEVSRKYPYIPKLEPFNTRKSKIDIFLKDPPLIQKSQNEISDYCVTLEGDECCSCWDAYSELEELEKKATKKEVESLIFGADSVQSLIRQVHFFHSIYKPKQERHGPRREVKVEENEAEAEARSRRGPIPDGLPKTEEELKEEEEALMPDSSFTRLLRAIGGRPAWSSPLPDHETD